MHPRSPLLSLSALALAVAGLAACSSEDAETTVAVTGTDSACEIAEAELPAGNIGFEFTNKADKVSELYVLTESGDTVSEVENVTTGSTRTLTVDLSAGAYEVRCKPGQSGSGFASTFEVTGEGGHEPRSEATADRTVRFDAVDFTYEDLDLTGITAGEEIRFEMTNSGEQAHEFEVLDPAGEALGEVASVEPGEEGATNIVFEEPGTYTYQCILEDPATHEGHDELGMVGTFTVEAPS